MSLRKVLLVVRKTSTVFLTTTSHRSYFKYLPVLCIHNSSKRTGRILPVLVEELWIFFASSPYLSP